MSDIKQIDPANWEEFLRDFAARNRDRRARFDVFRRDGSTEEEAREEHLEDIHLRSDGVATAVEIVRIDRGRNDAEKRDVVTNVRGIAVQYDTDGSEDALEITDDENTLISLHFESKVDGAS